MPLTNDGATLALESGLVAATFYMSLHTGSPPTSSNEVSGNGYAREQVLASQMTTTDNSSALNASIQWNTPTGSGWGTPTVLGIYDALTGGDLLGYGTITPAISAIVANTDVDTNSGNLTFTIPLS